MELLQSIESWHWLSLGGFLLLLEVLGAGGFLFGIAIGAILMAVTKGLMPGLGWQWQFVLFSGYSVVATLVYWKRFRAFNQTTADPELNNRVARLIGSRAEIFQAVVAGQGKVQIADALWQVKCDQDLEEGALVEVVSAEGMTLIVKPVG